MFQEWEWLLKAETGCLAVCSTKAPCQERACMALSRLIFQPTSDCLLSYLGSYPGLGLPSYVWINEDWFQKGHDCYNILIPVPSRTWIQDANALESLKRLTSRNNLVLLVPMGLFLECEHLRCFTLALIIPLLSFWAVHQHIGIRYLFLLRLFFATRVLS